MPEGIGAFGLVLGKEQLLGLGAVEALAIVVALAVSTAAKAGFGEELLLHFALLAQVNLSFEGVDLLSHIRGNFPGKPLFPGRRCTHVLNRL